jgi:hypothetical protein
VVYLQPSPQQDHYDFAVPGSSSGTSLSSGSATPSTRFNIPDYPSAGPTGLQVTLPSGGTYLFNAILGLGAQMREIVLMTIAVLRLAKLGEVFRVP